MGGHLHDLTPQLRSIKSAATRVLQCETKRVSDAGAETRRCIAVIILMIFCVLHATVSRFNQ